MKKRAAVKGIMQWPPSSKKQSKNLFALLQQDASLIYSYQQQQRHGLILKALTAARGRMAVPEFPRKSSRGFRAE
jgi:hypothetical protein